MTKEDQYLVEEAQKGNEDAFSRLIQNHRAKAIHWAKVITKDPYLAEDIVQDTILRSYLHLEKLEKSERFLPWLRSMVRNQAIDYIRKNKRMVQTPQEDIERISHTDKNPDQILEERDWLDAIQQLSQSLTERDQRIFEAHFFKQQPPDHIAKQFNMKISNVYNIISRTKVKLQTKAFQQEIERFIHQRQQDRSPSKNILKTPNLQSSYTSLGHVLHEVFTYISSKSYSLSEIMGYSGQAFRIQSTEDVGLSSSLIYDWSWVLGKVAAIFGTRSYSIGKPNQTPTPELLLKALVLIHDSIDRGIPAIVWNLTTSEFGIVYGYDTEKGIVYIWGCHSHLTASCLYRTWENGRKSGVICGGDR
ncbi:RNA polymerase sigma factor [Salinibacillus xinjiangensis]|uniref:Sigma-70 family RNA polymerase sigma factor n=1 Tax=Salinibacillus xinjiangensis TaxID=1229268 RepID=A0A6G1XAA2_9BACI|nr:sigma-70 family RNA polymerase sigma factor [Salinibacillus xinjiangensis]MRG87835.1 sigma-70 family RNA polymerase sigma factor [Salinibacillus xinjiangensis]